MGIKLNFRSIYSVLNANIIIMGHSIRTSIDSSNLFTNTLRVIKKGVEESTKISLSSGSISSKKNFPKEESHYF